LRRREPLAGFLCPLLVLIGANRLGGPCRGGTLSFPARRNELGLDGSSGSVCRPSGLGDCGPADGSGD
jgi:hypothetical protein